MAFIIDIAASFQKVFGLVPPPQLPANATEVDVDNPNSSLNTVANGSVSKQSFLNTPIYETSSFSDSSGKTYDLPDALIIDIKPFKKIVKTEIAGRDGTVKEYINMGDYKIRFRGFVINPNSNEYPVAGMKALMEWLTIGGSIKITNNILNNVFGLMNIVIDGEIDFPRNEGEPGCQPFTFYALSDEAPELILKNNNGVIINPS